MKKRFFKIISCFLIVFTLSLSFTQERQKVNANAEVITLTSGTLYVVAQILVAVGVVGSTSEVTYSLGQSYMNWLDENNTEQAQKIRAMTPVSCDTPGSIEEEQLKEAYKYKAKLQSGEITLPSVPTIQKIGLGQSSVVNTSNVTCSYAETNNLDYKSRCNAHTVFKLNTIGCYRLCFTRNDGQSYMNNERSYFFNCTEVGESLVLFSHVYDSYYSLGIQFLDKQGNDKTIYITTTLNDTYANSRWGFISNSAVENIQTDKFNDTYSFDLEFLEGVGTVDGSNTSLKEISADDITYPDSTIPASEAGSICINVPDNIANSWDTPATSDVISSDSAITNENGDVWDSAKGWISQEVSGILGVLGDILGAIKSIGKDVWDFFEEILNNILNKIGDVIDAINSLTWVDVISAITGVPTTILEGIAEALGLESLFNNVIDTIKSIPLSIYNLFDSILSGILDAINGIVDGIIEGLKKLFIPTLSFKDSIDTLKEKFVLPKLSLPSSDIKKEPLKLNKTVDISILKQSYTIDITLDQDWFPILREIMLGLMVLALVFFAQRKTSAFFSGGDD